MVVAGVILCDARSICDAEWGCSLSEGDTQRVTSTNARARVDPCLLLGCTSLIYHCLVEMPGPGSKHKKAKPKASAGGSGAGSSVQRSLDTLAQDVQDAGGWERAADLVCRHFNLPGQYRRGRNGCSR
jgi:hypothetical protein